jgi:hypothetical protein
VDAANVASGRLISQILHTPATAATRLRRPNHQNHPGAGCGEQAEALARRRTRTKRDLTKGFSVEIVQANYVEGQAPVMLNVKGQAWRFSISGVTKVGRELFISIVLQGAELCTAVVHVHDHIVLGVTARQILDRACEWLLARGDERHVYIELAAVN